MHQVSSRLSKLALSVMLAFALVPTASVAAMADPQISDPASALILKFALQYLFRKRIASFH